jgi:hypothetical protein
MSRTAPRVHIWQVHDLFVEEGAMSSDQRSVDQILNPWAYQAGSGAGASGGVQPAAAPTSWGAGGAGSMQVQLSQLHEASTSTDTLGSQMQSCVRELEQAHSGVAVGVHGFSLASALTQVVGSWSDRLGAVKAECWSISQTFTSTASNHQDNEHRIAVGMHGWLQAG